MLLQASAAVLVAWAGIKMVGVVGGRMKLVSVFVRLSQVGLGDMEETVYCEAWGLWSERTGRYGGSVLKLYSGGFRSALMSQ
jgi:hypothetical protein